MWFFKELADAGELNSFLSYVKPLKGTNQSFREALGKIIDEKSVDNVLNEVFISLNDPLLVYCKIEEDSNSKTVSLYFVSAGDWRWLVLVRKASESLFYPHGVELTSQNWLKKVLLTAIVDGMQSSDIMIQRLISTISPQIGEKATAKLRADLKISNTVPAMPRP